MIENVKKCVCGNNMTMREYTDEWVCKRCGRKRPMVVRGCWEQYGNDEDLSGSYFCSRCGYSMDETEYLDVFSHFNYCPNCGAKMGK